MSNEKESSLEKCSKVIKKFLNNSPCIPLSRERSVAYIDNAVRDHLIEQGHEDWLVNDISYGYQVGKTSESALVNFMYDQEIFNNPHLGKYKLDVDHGPMSVRSFKAIPVSE